MTVRFRLRVLVVGSAALLAALAMMTASATTPTSVRADNSSCGVRHQGPTAEGHFEYAYYVRNKCNQSLRFEVRLPTFGRTIPCRTVWPGQVKGFSATNADNNWYVTGC